MLINCVWLMQAIGCLTEDSILLSVLHSFLAKMNAFQVLILLLAFIFSHISIVFVGMKFRNRPFRILTLAYFSLVKCSKLG